ncbi:unnamed protein product, partial [Mesorhabditis belari]|uniref:Uncharacterized protein n=1 Tax=Mesorhabditis belari TaxID=2138241 RepID=A0AAF3EJC7_9BILA
MLQALFLLLYISPGIVFAQGYGYYPGARAPATIPLDEYHGPPPSMMNSYAPKGPLPLANNFGPFAPRQHFVPQPKPFWRPPPPPRPPPPNFNYQPYSPPPPPPPRQDYDVPPPAPSPPPPPPTRPPPPPTTTQSYDEPAPPPSRPYVPPLTWRTPAPQPPPPSSYEPYESEENEYNYGPAQTTTRAAYRPSPSPPPPSTRKPTTTTQAPSSYEPYESEENAYNYPETTTTRPAYRPPPTTTRSPPPTTRARTTTTQPPPPPPETYEPYEPYESEEYEPTTKPAYRPPPSTPAYESEENEYNYGPVETTTEQPTTNNYDFAYMNTHEQTTPPTTTTRMTKTTTTTTRPTTTRAPYRAPSTTRAPYRAPSTTQRRTYPTTRRTNPPTTARRTTHRPPSTPPTPRTRGPEWVTPPMSPKIAYFPHSAEEGESPCDAAADEGDGCWDFFQYVPGVKMGSKTPQKYEGVESEERSEENPYQPEQTQKGYRAGKEKYSEEVPETYMVPPKEPDSSEFTQPPPLPVNEKEKPKEEIKATEYKRATDKPDVESTTYKFPTGNEVFVGELEEPVVIRDKVIEVNLPKNENPEKDIDSDEEIASTRKPMKPSKGSQLKWIPGDKEHEQEEKKIVNESGEKNGKVMEMSTEKTPNTSEKQKEMVEVSTEKKEEKKEEQKEEEEEKREIPKPKELKEEETPTKVLTKVLTPKSSEREESEENEKPQSTEKTLKSREWKNEEITAKPIIVTSTTTSTTITTESITITTENVPEIIKTQLTKEATTMRTNEVNGSDLCSPNDLKCLLESIPSESTTVKLQFPESSTIQSTILSDERVQNLVERGVPNHVSDRLNRVDVWKSMKIKEEFGKDPIEVNEISIALMNTQKSVSPTTDPRALTDLLPNFTWFSTQIVENHLVNEHSLDPDYEEFPKPQVPSISFPLEELPLTLEEKEMNDDQPNETTEGPKERSIEALFKPDIFVKKDVQGSKINFYNEVDELPPISHHRGISVQYLEADRPDDANFPEPSQILQPASPKPLLTKVFLPGPGPVKGSRKCCSCCGRAGTPPRAPESHRFDELKNKILVTPSNASPNEARLIQQEAQPTPPPQYPQPSQFPLFSPQQPQYQPVYPQSSGCPCQSPPQSPCCQPAQPCCLPQLSLPLPRPCCIPQAQLCCQPPPPPPIACCPPPPPCCSQPVIPPCQRACPSCPCRRRMALAIRRLKRQSLFGSCQQCSLSGEPYRASEIQGGCTNCAARLTGFRSKRSPADDVLKFLGFQVSAPSCAACSGSAMRMARRRKRQTGCESGCTRRKRETETLQREKRSNPIGCSPCNNLGQLFARSKRETENRVKRSSSPFGCPCNARVSTNYGQSLFGRYKRQVETVAECDATCCDFSSCPNEASFERSRHRYFRSIL